MAHLSEAAERATDDLRAELFRLDEGARGELLPGNSHRESEIVLDSRTRSRLTARRVAFDHQHIQPFGRSVNCRGQSAGSSADDDQIVHAAFIDSCIQPEALSSLGVAGIAKHQFAPANQHRDIRHPDFEVIEQWSGHRDPFSTST